MPLQNRVTPWGDLIADSARGLFMGNRGGRFHRDDRTLGQRRHASRQWICCRLAFNGRHRKVWGDSYTELFFLDEPTALAAGHRPCFECRRADARAFAAAWATAEGSDAPPSAPAMDAILHAQRLQGRTKRLHRRKPRELPDGAFVTLPDAPGAAFAVCGGALMRWRPGGYAVAMPIAHVEVDVLTPPAILAVLSAGYDATAADKRRRQLSHVRNELGEPALSRPMP